MDKAAKCSNGCSKYSKSTDEIYEAATKHRETALKLKDLSEKQRNKIHEYKLKIEQLEYEIEEKNHSEDASEKENMQLRETAEKLCRKNEKNWVEIGKFCSDLEEEKSKIEEKNKEIEIFIKKKEISDKLIKNLQSENLILAEKQAKETDIRINLDDKVLCLIENNKENISKLLKEIEEIQKVTNLKENKLKEVANEKESVKERLAELERENMELKEKIEKDDSEKEHSEIEDSRSLSEELGMFDPRSQNVSFECGEDFVNADVKVYEQSKNEESLILKMKLKEIEIEKQVCSQKVKLTADILKLKDIEASLEKRCKCRGFCRIYHSKHNWCISYSKVLVDKLRSIDSKQSL